MSFSLTGRTRQIAAPANFPPDLTLHQQEAISRGLCSSRVSIIRADPQVMASTRGFYRFKPSPNLQLRST